MLLEGCRGLCWDTVVGRRPVSLYFLALLSPSDDDVACVMTNVDHVVEVAVGVVVIVTMLFLLAVGETLTPKSPLLVKQVTTLVKIFCWVLLFQLHSDLHCWMRCRRILLGCILGFYDCGRNSFHVVGKILVKIIRIVVIEVETLRGVTLRFMDFGDANHEDFTAKVLNFLVLFARGRV